MPIGKEKKKRWIIQELFTVARAQQVSGLFVVFFLSLRGVNSPLRQLMLPPSIQQCQPFSEKHRNVRQLCS